MCRRLRRHRLPCARPSPRLPTSLAHGMPTDFPGSCARHSPQSVAFTSHRSGWNRASALLASSLTTAMPDGLSVPRIQDLPSGSSRCGLAAYAVAVRLGTSSIWATRRLSPPNLFTLDFPSRLYVRRVMVLPGARKKAGRPNKERPAYRGCIHCVVIEIEE